MKFNTNYIRKTILLLFVVGIATANAQEELLYTGRYWSEDEANLVIKDFSKQWNDLASWEKRAAAYIFFAYHLKLDLGNVTVTNRVQEDFVSLLLQDNLKVFTASP